MRRLARASTLLVLLSITILLSYSFIPIQSETISRIEGHCSIGAKNPAKTWYLPEGSSKWGFECWLSVMNPSNQPASCKFTYMTQDSGARRISHTISPNSRGSFSMEQDIGKHDASIMVKSNVPVVAERSMYKNSKREGHSSIGTTNAALDYYLAEGSTAHGFTTYILIQNPNDLENEITVTYMTSKGAKPQKPFKMEPNSRSTIKVNTKLPSPDFSTKVHGSLPIIAERSMFWGDGTPAGEACHDSIGVTAPSSTWYLAEGCTNGGFETWVLIQNPGNKPAKARVTYMTPTGAKVGPLVPLGPGTRQSVEVALAVPKEWSVSTQVTSDIPVIAERALYWNSRGGGHNSVGVTAPAASWYLAEGSTKGGFETWVLVQNPGSVPATAHLTYMTPAGPKGGPAVPLSPGSRQSVNIAASVPDEWSVSTKVTCDRPIVAERSTYWSKETAPPPTPQPQPQPQPQPTPPQPAPYTYDFSGTGNQATPLFGLQAGITLFDMTNDDQKEKSNFIIWLKDQAGNDVDLIGNEIGSFNGGKCMSAPANNNYILNITSTGRWKVHITQPRPGTAPGSPQTFTGKSQGYSGYFALNAGLVRFNMSYVGDDNFIIWLYNANGEQVDLVENEIGNRNDSKVINVPQGIYILDITGSGSWSVGVTQ